MMETIMLEIRDRATTIPALAVVMCATQEEERRLLARAGFPIDSGNPLVMLMRLEDQEAHCDAFAWNRGRGRTMHEAHLWIQQHHEELVNGDVVDVEYILGESAAPKKSEVQR